ncbi:dienelactone hydrolase [Xylogone sp. PMI_703]|nr:dienelactone hydrolase [Xylogone sp. PMI_703]
MTSNPPAKCCAIGYKYEENSIGKYIKINDVEVYITEPATPSTNAIILLTDIVGHRFINLQLLADQFAANGYLVVMPDLFEGDPVPLNHPTEFDFMKWLIPAHLPAKIDPIVEGTIEYLKKDRDIQNIGGAGYCFGAKYVVRFLKQNQLDAGFIAHPSLIETDELEAIERPLSIAAAEHDTVFPTPKRHESEEILLKLSPLSYQIAFYSGTDHGFAVRGDISQRQIKFAKEQTFFQALAWFGEHLEKGN